MKRKRKREEEKGETVGENEGKRRTYKQIMEKLQNAKMRN